MMSDANSRQEGGDHYKQNDLPQHWDLAVMYNWDPFQYQITKYVMRWKDKHLTFEQRLMDLKKARHFIDKYIEEAEKYDKRHQVRPQDVNDSLIYTGQYSATMLNRPCVMDMYTCKKCGARLEALSREEAHRLHGECARSDTDQG